MNQPLRIYVSFDATRSKNPTQSDLKYYFLIRAWLRQGRIPGTFVDAHRETPRTKVANLRRELARRLRRSDLLLLILSEDSAVSRGWMPWEIEFGTRECRLPILCTYPGRTGVDAGLGHPPWWPAALRRVVSSGQVQLWHAEFRVSALVQGVRVTAQGRCAASPPRARRRWAQSDSR